MGTTHSLPTTPWGLLPPRMRVLYIATPRRTGAWLAEAFASDSACAVTLDEAGGGAAGLAALRERTYDAVLVSHEPPLLDALELVDGLRSGGAEEPLVILGQPSEQELAAMAFEVGADAYVCVNTATTRTLLWIVARATERHHLIRDNRRLAESDRHRLEQEQREAGRLLSEQRDLIRDFAGDHSAAATVGQMSSATSAHEVDRLPNGVDAGILEHYRELLRAHVIMGSGNLSAEMSSLAEMLASSGVSAPRTMQLHVQVLEELVDGLGSRSARHVMTRADLLALEMLAHLAEHYRVRSLSVTGQPQPIQ